MILLNFLDSLKKVDQRIHQQLHLHHYKMCIINSFSAYFEEIELIAISN